MESDLPLTAIEAIQFMIGKMFIDINELYPNIDQKNFIHHIQYGCALYAYNFFNYNQEAEEFLSLSINEAKRMHLLNLNE